ncbi:MAG: HDOD domain-containing protein [Deltaproteobacteria bacterium]|nr:HDOD domain-containing protein [Deltaproteobacteria bacterium]
MIHAFRLGPITSTGTPVYAYVGLAEGGAPRIHMSPGDREGLAALQAESPGQPIACEEALAGAAKGLGLTVAPLPAGLLQLRATLAYELATGVAHGASKAGAIAAFLEAAAAFWGAHTWELVGPEDKLHVLFEEGRVQIQGEVSVLGGDGTRFPGLALCDEPATLKKLQGLPSSERAEKLLELAGMIVDMEREPAWAAEVIGEAYTLPRVPTPQRKRHGRVAAMVTADLVMAAALLRALAAYSEVEEGGHAEATVQAAGLSLRAALGPSAPPAAPAASSGLTPALTPARGAPGPAGSPGREAAPQEAGPALTPAKPTAATPTPGPEAAAEATGPAPAAEIADAAAEPAVRAAQEAEPAPEAAAETAAAAEEGTAPVAEIVPPEGAVQPEEPAEPEAPPPPPPRKKVALPLDPVLTPARPGPPPPPPAPPPEPQLTPVREPALTPVAPAAEAVPAAPAPAAASVRSGWLARAWSALRGGGKLPAEAKPEAAPPAAPPPEAAAAADAAVAPAPAVPPVPEHPFAALARALKVEIPAEPPPPPAEDQPSQAQLAGSLQETAAAAAELIAFPAVALQIVELVHSPRADATSVAGFISRDPALAADVVRVANSAAFRGVSEVGSVRDAVARLGMEEVGRVASAVAARKLLDPASGAAADKGRRTTALFTRAVAVATAASAAALRLRGARSDHVWLGGLLHDVGRALALQALARLTSESSDHLTSIAVADRALEQVHVEVGAAALGRWGLPEWLQEMAARHHDDEVPADPEHLDLHLVRLTSALAWLRDPAVGARAAREVLQSARALGFGVPAVRALATDLREAEQRAQVLAR